MFEKNTYYEKPSTSQVHQLLCDKSSLIGFDCAKEIEQSGIEALATPMTQWLLEDDLIPENTTAAVLFFADTLQVQLRHLIPE